MKVRSGLARGVVGGGEILGEDGERVWAGGGGLVEQGGQIAADVVWDGEWGGHGLDYSLLVT